MSVIKDHNVGEGSKATGSLYWALVRKLVEVEGPDMVEGSSSLLQSKPFSAQNKAMPQGLSRWTPKKSVKNQAQHDLALGLGSQNGSFSTRIKSVCARGSSSGFPVSRSSTRDFDAAVVGGSGTDPADGPDGGVLAPEAALSGCRK